MIGAQAAHRDIGDLGQAGVALECLVGDAEDVIGGPVAFKHHVDDAKASVHVVEDFAVHARIQRRLCDGRRCGDDRFGAEG
ncbi:hypothetical protein [Xanthomonas campestris]|uniref:hypothetical protein n=1 Tax=Xanthomonas campestris TaxID=339 RepID=UPI0023677637|nr:hypothetical protein [Xanthomonas campestris]